MQISEDKSTQDYCNFDPDVAYDCFFSKFYNIYNKIKIFKVKQQKWTIIYKK